MADGKGMVMKWNPDGPVADYVNTLVSYVILNCLFLLCCIPVVTIGPAVAALYRVTLQEARKEYGYLYRSFFRYMKEMFFHALGIAFFYFILFLFLSFSIVFWYSYGGLMSMAAFWLLTILLLVVFGAGLYSFPLLGRFQNTVRQTIKNAFCMAVVHGGYTILLMGIEVAAVVLFYYFPIFRIFMLLVGFVFIALCKSLILSKIFERYEPEKE